MFSNKTVSRNTALLLFALFSLVSLTAAQTTGVIGGGIYAPVAAGCTTPVGTHLTESWGDSSTLCWTSGPSSCNHTWTIAGTPGESVVSSPAGAPANTACANSLQVNYVLGSAASLGVSFTAITSGTFDAVGTLYITTGVSSGNSGYLLCFTVSSGTCDGSGQIASLVLTENSGQKFQGSGSTTSAQVAATTATWHTFDVHVDLGTRTNCSIAIDGGAVQTFTCNTGSPGTIYFGPQHFVNSSYNFDIGNVDF